MTTDSHFPLLIVYLDNQQRVKVLTPESIESGRSFRVLETQYDRNDLRSYADVAWEEDRADGFLDSTDPHP